MSILKTTGVSVCLMISALGANAQTVTITKGGQTRAVNKKGSKAINMVAGNESYFVNSNFESAEMKYYLEAFNGSGSPIAQNQLEVNPGVFNNSYGIDEVVSLGGKIYALVEHLDKPAGKNTLTARVVNSTGAVASSGTDVMSIAFEKTMNSGYNFSATSEDHNTLAVVGLLPYEKEMPAKLKIAVFDKDLNQKGEYSVSFPGEDTKNKSIKVAVANDGTVYIIKQTMLKNGEMALTVYQNSGSAELKEYTFEMTAPSYFTTYDYTVNPAGELIVSGTYYERKTVSTGDRKAAGIFYFTNKGKSEKIFKTFTLDAPVENLTARKVLVNGNTIFLTAEQYKEEKLAPPASSAGAASFDYNYNYTHKNEYVIAMDADGNKKFELNVSRDFVARDFDQQYYSAYFICNGKLTLIYNDQTGKYTQNSGYNSSIPVLVQITNDGLMQPPVVFMDKLKLPDYYVLYPVSSVQKSPNEISMLMKYGDNSQYVNLKID